VTDLVLKLPDFTRATRISVYLSMPNGEISTTDIVRQALVQGKKIYVPYIQKPTRSDAYMEMFALRSQEDLDSLQPDSWGIPTLDEASLQSRENVMGGFGPSQGGKVERRNLFEGLDLVLLPGMAFDHSGGRLGHGKGFYDRFLQNYWDEALGKGIDAKMPRLGIGILLMNCSTH
jgi:5-formyltetrahydrofolate cyclo-ligase